MLVVVQSNLGRLFTVDPRTGVADEIDLGDETVTAGDGILLDGKKLYVVRNQQNRIAVVRLARPGERDAPDALDAPRLLRADDDRRVRAAALRGERPLWDAGHADDALLGDAAAQAVARPFVGSPGSAGPPAARPEPGSAVAQAGRSVAAGAADHDTAAAARLFARVLEETRVEATALDQHLATRENVCPSVAFAQPNEIPARFIALQEIDGWWPETSIPSRVPAPLGGICASVPREVSSTRGRPEPAGRHPSFE